MEETTVVKEPKPMNGKEKLSLVAAGSSWVNAKNTKPDRKFPRTLFWLIVALISLFSYLVLKLVLFRYFELKSIKDFSFYDCFQLALRDFLEHIDLIGISVGLYIAISIDEKTKHQFDDLKAIERQMEGSLSQLEITNAKIKKTTKNLEDATRKVIETLPGILDESINIVQKVRSQEDRLFIMNYTSKFGVMHSFNKRFIDQIKITTNGIAFNPDPNNNREYLSEKLNPFKAKIDKLYRKTCKATRKTEKFKLITYETKALDSCFVKKYFDTENPKNLFYYKYQQNKAVQFSDIDIQDAIDTNTISQIVINEHDDAIRELNKLSNDCVLTRTEIPYQMYLAEYIDEKNNVCNESLIIYAVDEKDNNSSKRNFIGISSKNKQMFKAFETIFNDLANEEPVDGTKKTPTQ